MTVNLVIASGCAVLFVAMMFSADAFSGRPIGWRWIVSGAVISFVMSIGSSTLLDQAHEIGVTRAEPPPKDINFMALEAAVQHIAKTVDARLSALERRLDADEGDGK